MQIENQFGEREKQRLAVESPAPLSYGGIGDAYDRYFEFHPPMFVRDNNDLTYPLFLNFRPGAYSDDTHMQIALAEIIVSETEWTPEAIASSFV